MKTHIIALIKIFDKEEYADAFIERGEMFCRTIGDFKVIEDGELRGDAYECVTDWHQPDRVKLLISYTDIDGTTKSFPLKDLAGPVVVQNSGHNDINVYCCYAVTVPDFNESYETEEQRLFVFNKINKMLKMQTTLPSEVLSFGKFAVMIYRVQDFIDRVKSTAMQEGKTLWRGTVKYFDSDTFHGSFDPIESMFRKRNIYEYQSEYRFAFGSKNSSGPMTIKLGSLKEIAFKLQTDEINGKIQIKLDETSYK